METTRLTVGDALEVVIRLRSRQIGAYELEVDLVFHVGKEDKG